MNRRTLFAGLVIGSIAASFAFAEQNVSEVAGVDGLIKPEAIGTARPRLPKSWGNEVLFASENETKTPALNVARLMAEDALQAKHGPVRIGVCQEIEPVSSANSGSWVAQDDGGWLWTFSFFVTDAKSVRIHLKPFDPPAGAELFVYAPGELESVRGPITASYQPSKELWTPTIHGSAKIRLEYHLPAEFSPDDEGVHVVIDSVLNNYRQLDDGLQGGQEGGPLPCHLDVSCFPDWEVESRGVCRLSFVTSEGSFVCSGAMLGRIGNDMTPLLMTAFHCGINNSNLSSMLATWFYRANSCNGTVPSINTLPQTPGVVVLRNINANDFSFIGLSKTNTGGVGFLGWTSSSNWDEDSPTVGIHHPRGSWQRISFGSQDDTNVSCIPGAGDGWHNLTANGNGLTEPGSSGSPIFDVNRRVRGTLSCGTFGCNQENGQTYGRFDLAYPDIRPWMNPADPVYLDAGYNGLEEGTNSRPFNSVLAGAFAVLSGSTMFLDTGTYDGPGLTIDKPVTLRSVGGTATIR